MSRPTWEFGIVIAAPFVAAKLGVSVRRMVVASLLTAWAVGGALLLPRDTAPGLIAGTALQFAAAFGLSGYVTSQVSQRVSKDEQERTTT